MTEGKIGLEVVEFFFKMVMIVKLDGKPQMEQTKKINKSVLH